jgi:Tfp pilus assembly protein PilV
MQAIKIIKRKMSNNRGSALVGVVVASILIGIAVTGVMSVTGSTINHEAAALENEKAFYAAESGLLIGTRWRTMQNPTLWAHGTVEPICVELINGTSVNVKDSVGLNYTAYITSTAMSAKLPYIKKISWVTTYNDSAHIFTFSNWTESNVPL